MDDTRSSPRPASPLRLLPWAVAVIALVAALWFGAQAAMARAQNQALRDRLALAEVTLQSVTNQLEAERMVSARLVQRSAAADDKPAETRATAQPKP